MDVARDRGNESDKMNGGFVDGWDFFFFSLRFEKWGNGFDVERGCLPLCTLIIACISTCLVIRVFCVI